MTDPIAIASRAFNSETDVAQLESFLLDVVAKRPPHTYWHIGNLFWSLYFGMKYSLERDVRLWEDQDGALLGFAWFEDPGSVDLQVHPSLRGSGLLETPMLAWAAEHAVGFRHDREPTLNVAAAPDDTELLEYLLAQGFEHDGFSMACMIRDLDGPVPKPSLPAGWSVRHVADETEWLERVEAHRDAWNPSSHTIEAYRRLRGAHRYTPELDIVAVSPDGAFASYALFWLDPINRIGLLEPVGTRIAYRRQGLSRAVLCEGLRRLQTYGARCAWVSTGAHSVEAISLYESVGFRLRRKDLQLIKRL